MSSIKENMKEEKRIAKLLHDNPNGIVITNMKDIQILFSAICTIVSDSEYLYFDDETDSEFWESVELTEFKKMMDSCQSIRRIK